MSQEREKKMREALKPLIVLLMLLASPALASEITVSGGLAHTSNSNYGDGGSINVRIQNPIYQDLSLGVEYSYHSPQQHGTNDAQGNYVSYGSVEGNSVLAEILYYPNVNWTLKPYILSGWGWSWWDFNASQYTKDQGASVSLRSSFAQKYGIGAVYPINDRWSLMGEWSWFGTNIPKSSQPTNWLGDDDRSGRVRIGQEELCLTAGLKYKW